MEMVVRRANFTERLDLNKNIVRTGSILLGIFLLIPITASAAAPDLTEIFTTKAFQGCWEVVYQFNWLGGIMNYIISFYCLLGLMLIMYSRIVTLLYLSARNTWDTVYEIKESAKGPLLGFPDLFKNTMQSNYGSGLDAFVSFFLGLLPNVKKYSDYNPECMSRGTLNDDDNALNYILKTAIPTITLMFFLSIGFSGTLARSYGTVVSAMATFADEVVAVNLDTYVQDIFEVGAAPDSILKDGTAYGDFLYSLNKRVYSNVISEAGIVNSEGKESIEAKCEEAVKNAVNANTVANSVGGAITNDSEWKNVKCSVDASKNPNATGNNIVIPIADILGNKSTKYIHISFKKSGTQENYFKQNP